MSLGFLIICGVFCSLYAFGVLRTALWLLPAIFVREFLAVFAASWLSFFMLSVWLAPYEKGFDFRRFKKDRWIILLFFTGVFTGALLYPVDIWVFGIGALFPLVWIRLFRLIRKPASEIFLSPKWLRFLLPALWLITFGLRFFEIRAVP